MLIFLSTAIAAALCVMCLIVCALGAVVAKETKTRTVALFVGVPMGGLGLYGVIMAVIKAGIV